MAAGAVAAALLLVLAVIWFEPHKLFIDEAVDEALPRGRRLVLPPRASETALPGAARSTATTLAAGDFRSLEHATSGKAVILELADGTRFLRFDDLSTSNGPDLRVYLSEIPASDDWYAYGERFVDLGALKGNIGDQNYRLPDGLDLARYKSAVIWCRRFTVGFGVAPLERA